METLSRVKKFLSNPLAAFLILACAVVVVAGDSLARPIWYDEALTVTNFSALPHYLDIYRCYQIPNNHICYSLLLRFWIDAWECLLPFSVLPLRLLSFLLSWGTVCLMWIVWKRRFGFQAATLAVAAFLLAPPFPIYAVAVRGYMFGAALLTLAVPAAASVRRRPGAARVASYFIVSTLCVGVMPSNVFPLLAIALVQLPRGLVWRRTLRVGILLAVIPVAALVLFYLPILDQFLRAARRTGGWGDSGQALVHYYGTLLVVALPLLPLVAIGLVAKIKSTGNRLSAAAPIIVAFLIPAAMFVLRDPAPFPRVFWSMWIPYSWVLAAAVRHAEAALRSRRVKRFTAPLTFIVVLIVLVGWSELCDRRRADVSRWLTPPNQQDDFFSPYFFKPSFDPPALIRRLKLILQRGPVLFFISPMADPPATLFYAKMMGFPMRSLLFDPPGKPLRLDPERTSTLMIISRGQRDFDEAKKRFNVESSGSPVSMGFHEIRKVAP